MKIPQKVNLAINEMFYCTSLKEHLLCFQQYHEELKDCNFIVFSESEGTKLPDVMCTNYDREFGIINIGCTNQYYAMNQEICKEMLCEGKSSYCIDICIDVDTQAISYLKDIFHKYKEIPQIEKRKELIDFLSLKNIDYSCNPYLIENACKEENKIDCYSNIISFMLFKSFNYDEYIATGKACYNVLEEEIYLDTDRLYKDMFSGRFVEAYQDIYKMQKALYALLLKAIYIEFSNSKRSGKNKIMDLFDFINLELGFIPERELEICYYYFMHHEKTVKFFKKVQKNSNDLFKTVNSMAWDLIHIRVIEKEYAFKPTDEVKFAIHVLLTYDQGLKDVLKINQIEQIALYQGVPLLKFSHQFIDEIPGAREKLLSEENMNTRYHTFENVNIIELIAKIENDVSLYMA